VRQVVQILFHPIKFRCPAQRKLGESARFSENAGCAEPMILVSAREIHIEAAQAAQRRRGDVISEPEK
jgi:hypothetical protein